MSCGLRSSSAELLYIPKHKTVLAAVVSPSPHLVFETICLSLSARTVNNFASFKTVLKTYLFRRFTD